MFLECGDPYLSFCVLLFTLNIILGSLCTERMSPERNLSSYYKDMKKKVVKTPYKHSPNTTFITKATIYSELLASRKKKKLLLNNHHCDSSPEYLLL